MNLPLSGWLIECFILYKFKEIDADNLYRQCTEIPWENHFIESSKICVDLLANQKVLKLNVWRTEG